MNNKEFDWSTVDKKWKYMATDFSGVTRLFTEKPRIEGWSFWVTTDEYEIVNPCHNWRETLIERHKEKAEIRTVGCAITDSQLEKLRIVIKNMEAENKE